MRRGNKKQETISVCIWKNQQLNLLAIAIGFITIAIDRELFSEEKDPNKNYAKAGNNGVPIMDT